MKLITIFITFLALLVIVGGYSYYIQKHSPSKTIFTFMGAPGSGKGTLAEQCAKNLGFTTLSTGNVLREAVARGDDLGKQAQGYMKEGKLVPDELVTSIVDDWLSKNLHNIDTLILDGYPRTAHQAELFLKLLHTKFANVSLRVVVLTIPDDAIVKRLADRLVCEKCQVPHSRKLLKDPTKLICESCGGALIKREDDKEKVVRERLKIYAQSANPLLDAYRAAIYAQKSKPSSITDHLTRATPYQIAIKIEQLDVKGKLPQQVFNEFKNLIKETTPQIATKPQTP